VKSDARKAPERSTPVGTSLEPHPVSVFLAIEQILLFTLFTTRSLNSSNVVFSIDQKFPEHVTNRYRVNEISGGKCLDHVLLVSKYSTRRPGSGRTEEAHARTGSKIKLAI
jgi:hypothetical protein